MFETYYRDVCLHLQQRRYRIIDQNLLKSLIFTFFSNTVKELQNVLRKIESDQKHQILLTEKALAQYNLMQEEAELSSVGSEKVAM